MKVKENKRIYIIISLILVFVLLFLFCVFNNKIGSTKAGVILENDNIKLTIDDTSISNGIADFEYNKTKRLKIDIDFKDTTSKDKKIEIDIENGLTYKLYPVIEQKDTDMQTIISEQDILYKAINNVSYPEIEQTQIIDTNPYVIVKCKNAYGKLIYNVNDNIEKLTLYIDVAADYHKLYDSEYDEQTKTYNNKLIEDAINVSVYKENKNINSLSLDTKIVVDDKIKLFFEKFDSIVYSSKTFASNNDNINYGYTKPDLFKIRDASNYLYYGFPNHKKAKITIYYPKNTDFVDFVYNNQEVATECKKVEKGMEETANCTIVDYNDVEDENKIIVTLNKFNGNFVNRYAVRYKVRTAEELKMTKDDVIEWTSTKLNNVEITFYDDTIKTYYSNELSKLDIYHPDSFVNKMNINTAQNINDDKDDSTFVYGPSVVIENNTPGKKVNQVMEYEIDPNYQAIGVTFPRASGVSIRDIEYKTNINNNWQKASINDSDITTFSLETIGIDLDSDIYFTGVKGVIDYYQEGYISSISSSKDASNAVVYGNLNSSIDRASVTFRMYEEPGEDNIIDENTLIERTQYVIYSDKKTIGVNPGTVSFTNNDSKIISNIYTNEDFHLIGYLRPHYYPYGSRIYMDNTEIYIKEPKGFTVDINNLSIRDELNENIAYELDKKTNKFGDVVYILKTNKRTGVNVSKRGILTRSTNEIKINIKYHVEDNCNYSNINMKDIIGIGNPEYTYVSRGAKDETDLNANNNIEEQVFYVSSDTLTIMPAKKFSIYSYVVKDNVEYDSYDQNNLDTIIEVKPNDIFEYVFNIKNNSEDSIDKYEIYIPIAKKGTNYGESFQKQAFSFDVSLLETLNSNELYDVYYSVDKNVKNVTDPKTMNYVTNINDKSLVTMVKIVSKKKLDVGEKYDISLKLKVEKNEFDSDASLNINNIVYDITSNTLTGAFKSNSNAFKLYAPSISGFIFNDLNLDKKYDNKDIPVISDILLELYKLNNDKYDKVTDINVDPKNGYFVIDDTNILTKGVYALKVIVPNYYIYSDLTYDGWIKDISFKETKAYYYEIGYIKCDIDFNIEDQIIGVGKEQEISIKDLKPDYFDLIKNEESAYNWYVSKEDSGYLKVNDKNSSSIIIEGLQETEEDVNLCVQVVDRYNNKKEKCAKVKVKESLSPVVKASDAHILVGSKIKYEEYLIEAIDYKDNKIKLDFNKNVNITTNIVQENGYATKVGVYDVTFEVTDDYGNKGTKSIKIYVDPISTIITNPSTYDNVIVNIVIIVISSIVVIITGIFIYKKRYRN